MRHLLRVWHCVVAMCLTLRRYGLQGSSPRETARHQPLSPRLPPAMLLQGAIRRRLTHKQTPGASASLPGAALAAELQAADGLPALANDARRQHVHWTMVATHNAQDVQPNQLSRVGFWKHLMRCYQEAHPAADSPTGCILQFACVSREKHQNAEKWEDRCDHFHAACFTTEKHYWRRVRRLSAEKYNIQLNAVAHDSYSTMYNYLRKATRRKPLYELDARPYHSPNHPQGDELKALLEVGEACHELRSAKRSAPHPSATVPLRSPFGIFFQWVTSNNCQGSKGAVRLERDAVYELREGRPQLLDFLRKNRAAVPDLIQYCWALNSADERLARMEQSRVDILLHAATGRAGPCANATSHCGRLYESILAHQGIDSLDFRHSLYETFLHGRRKGNAMMLVGGKDTGKTTLTEPSACIFKHMGTPQSDSFCPMQDARGFELFLWHDFRYSPGNPRKDEQGLRLDEGTWNRLLEGLPTRIGVAKSDSSRTDFVFEDNTPFIFTGPFKLVAYRNGLPDAEETQQLTCRLKYWEFSTPARAQLDRSFKPCAACWATWLLKGEFSHRSRAGHELDPFLARAAAVLTPGGAASSSSLPQPPLSPRGTPPPPSPEPPSAQAPAVPCIALPMQPAPGSEAAATSPPWFAQLEKLMAWREKGYLSDAEFRAAKAKLGL